MSFFNWDKTRTGAKKGFDVAWSALDKLGAPVNKLTNKIGSEAFWPTTLDKESDKAARILRSFCKDGFYAHIDAQQAEQAERVGEQVSGPKGKQKVLKKIPSEVIRKAKGLAIFTTMRTGLWVSGAGGSGVLVARNPETGEWSPPSGIMLHTAGLGFLVGVDIYDCVVVINTYEALHQFTKLRCTLGGEVSVVAGPVGMGGMLESDVRKAKAPVWTYLKSRGFYAGVQVDGSIVIERTDENERFYGEKLSARQISEGKVRHPPLSITMLMETLKAAQGDKNVDESALPKPGMTPGDAEIATDEDKSASFGIPSEEDPDPFGVKALESQGLEIREAGTQMRPSVEAFKFQPSPTSPIFSTFSHRRSIDSRRSSTRMSRVSTVSYSTVDHATQTDELELKSPTSLHSFNRSPVHEVLEEHEPTIAVQVHSPHLAEPFEEVYNSSHSNDNELSPTRHQTIPQILTTPPATPNEHPDDRRDAHDHEPKTPPNEYDSDHEQDHEHDNLDFSIVEAAPATQITRVMNPSSPSRARLVTIQVKKPAPPALPPRNPGRNGTRGDDASSVADRSSFGSVSMASVAQTETDTVETVDDKETAQQTPGDHEDDATTKSKESPDTTPEPDHGDFGTVVHHKLDDGQSEDVEQISRSPDADFERSPTTIPDHTETKQLRHSKSNVDLEEKSGFFDSDEETKHEVIVSQPEPSKSTAAPESLKTGTISQSDEEDEVVALTAAAPGAF